MPIKPIASISQEKRRVVWSTLAVKVETKKRFKKICGMLDVKCYQVVEDLLSIWMKDQITKRITNKEKVTHEKKVH